MGFGGEGWHPAGSFVQPWLHYPPLCLRGVISGYLPCRKDEQDIKSRALWVLRAPETWGMMLHPQQLLLKSVGIMSPPELSDGQNFSLGSLHTTTAIEMKRSWLNQPESGLFSHSGFLLAIPGDEAGGFWHVVFPPGECPQCCRRITHLPFTRGYLGFLPLSTEQLVGSNPKAI